MEPHSHEKLHGNVSYTTPIGVLATLVKQRSRGIALSSQWFKQDWGTTNTERTSASVLREMLTKHVISSDCDVPWPACSPPWV
jgi:hypothetical protein